VSLLAVAIIALVLSLIPRLGRGSALPRPQRFELLFLLATALPLLVALSEIGLQSGTMLPENAAALVGAGVLSVLTFPAIATSIHRRLASSPEPVTDSEAAEPPGDQPPAARH
jgi:hypothetical protein